jgi:hypothetical protein
LSIDACEVDVMGIDIQAVGGVCVGTMIIIAFLLTNQIFIKA